MLDLDNLFINDIKMMVTQIQCGKCAITATHVGCVLWYDILTGRSIFFTESGVVCRAFDIILTGIHQKFWNRLIVPFIIIFQLQIQFCLPEIFILKFIPTQFLYSNFYRNFYAQFLCSNFYTQFLSFLYSIFILNFYAQFYTQFLYSIFISQFL